MKITLACFKPDPCPSGHLETVAKFHTLVFFNPGGKVEDRQVGGSRSATFKVPCIQDGSVGREGTSKLWDLQGDRNVVK